MDFIPNISEEKKEVIKKVFNTMETSGIPGGLYEPESFRLATEWLEKNKLGIFINNEWESTNLKVGDTAICFAEKESLTKAYHAALEASTSWKSAPVLRASKLLNIAQNLEPEKHLFSLLESFKTEKLVRHVLSEFPLLVQSFYHAASSTAAWEQMNQWQPLGVVYIIASGDSYPLMSLYCLVATALAAGNAVILQVNPTCYYPACLFAEIVGKSGLPKGVFSLFCQDPTFLCGVDVSAIKGLKKIFFSGYYEEAEKLRQWSKSNGCDFELIVHAPYQRSTAIVLQGADLDSAAVEISQQFCYRNSASKTAGCRVLVQDSVVKSFTKKLRSRFEKLKIGSNLSNADISAATCGNAKSCPTVPEILKCAAEVLCLSEEPGKPLGPSLITNIQTSSTLFSKQVGGRLLFVTSFRTMKEAINICNHEKSGCDVSIWCERVPVALQVAHSLKVPNVWVNCYNVYDPVAGYGCAYRSGNAIFGGPRAIFQFLEPVVESSKSEEFDLKPAPTSTKRVFKMYYGGSSKSSDGNSVQDVHNKKGEVVYQVPQGTAKDIYSAVEAAVAVQPKWQSMSANSRARILLSAANMLSNKVKEFAGHFSDLTTLPLEKCSAEVEVCAKQLRSWASSCFNLQGSLQGTEMFGKVMQTQEALGVIGIVCPDECPLLAFVSLVVAAITTGNTVVVVPGLLSPLAVQLCEMFQKCGVPGGVINVITGSCTTLTTHLCKHMEVEAIWVHRCCDDCMQVARSSVASKKTVWIAPTRNWTWTQAQQQNELISRSTYTKTVWLPMGDIFAN